MPSSPPLSKAETVTPTPESTPSTTQPQPQTQKSSKQPRKQKDKEFLLGNFLRETFFSPGKSKSKLTKKPPTSNEPAHHTHALFTHNEEPLRADQSALMPRHAGRKPGFH